MLLLICHLIGDYVLQNHWMALNKVKSWWPALIHAATYMAPFCILDAVGVMESSSAAKWVMFGTHAVIDRFQLAQWWTEWWGVGCEGVFMKTLRLGIGPWNRDFHAHPDITARAPDWLGVWLRIIVDNTAHLVINYFAIMCL